MKMTSKIGRQEGMKTSPRVMVKVPSVLIALIGLVLGKG